MTPEALVSGIAGIVASAAPMIFAVVGETISERGGVVNLALNGIILLSAMIGFAVAYHTGSVALGFAAGAAIGAIVAAIVSTMSLYLRQSQVAIGFVFALLCRDLAYFLGNPYIGLEGPTLSMMPLPLFDRIPILGPIFFQHDLMTYASLATVVAAWWFCSRTHAGLILAAVGERPEAAYVRGAPVLRVRLVAAVVGGALAGLAGPLYSLSIKAGWKGTISGLDGLGWIALAITIFGGWRIVRAAFGVYLFACLQWLGIVLQPLFPGIPTQVLQIAPFPLMIFTLLLVNVGDAAWVERLLAMVPERLRCALRKMIRTLRARPPAGLGQSYRY